MPRIVWFLSILVIFSATVSSSVAEPSIEQLYQDGQHKEEIVGDLEAAIESYRKVVEKQLKDRKIAAQAQLRIGLCYEKLGKTQEAQTAFRQVADRFPDYAEVVDTARRYLKLTTVNPPQSLGLAATSGSHYFPLAVGNRWVFQKTHGETKSQETMELTEQMGVGGAIKYVGRGGLWGEDFDEYRPWIPEYLLELLNEFGTPIAAQQQVRKDEVRLVHVSKYPVYLRLPSSNMHNILLESTVMRGSMTVPAGKFDDVIEIAVKMTFPRTEYMFHFAKAVGLIRMTHQPINQDDATTWELESYELVAGPTISYQLFFDFDDDWQSVAVPLGLEGQPVRLTKENSLGNLWSAFYRLLDAVTKNDQETIERFLAPDAPASALDLIYQEAAYRDGKHRDYESVVTEVAEWNNEALLMVQKIEKLPDSGQTAQISRMFRWVRRDGRWLFWGNHFPPDWKPPWEALQQLGFIPDNAWQVAGTYEAPASMLEGFKLDEDILLNTLFKIHLVPMKFAADDNPDAYLNVAALWENEQFPALLSNQTLKVGANEDSVSIVVAFLNIVSPDDRWVKLYIGGAGQCYYSWDGEPIHRVEAFKGGNQFNPIDLVDDKRGVNLPLKQGDNIVRVFLVRDANQTDQAWGVIARMTDSIGIPTNAIDNLRFVQE